MATKTDNAKKPFKELDDKKKAWTLTMMYFKKCTRQGAFHFGKPCQDFFKVRSFFTAIDTNSMVVLYNYLNQIEHKEMSLTECFIAANAQNAQSFMKANMNTQVRQSTPFNLNAWLSDNA